MKKYISAGIRLMMRSEPPLDPPEDPPPMPTADDAVKDMVARRDKAFLDYLAEEVGDALCDNNLLLKAADAPVSGSPLSGTISAGASLVDLVYRCARKVAYRMMESGEWTEPMQDDEV
jgi:hypothetical protein